MLITIPMDTTDVHEAEITSVADAKTWAQLCVEDGELVEVLHSDKYDGFENWSEIIVVSSSKEDVEEFVNMSMLVLVAFMQKSIDDIVEAYLFRELHDFPN